MVSLTFSKSIVDRLKENITKALKLNNIRLYRLAQALLWFSESMGTQEIARLIGVCERTIVNWLKTFMHKGIGWLVGQHYQGRGRKEKLTKDQKKQLTDELFFILAKVLTHMKYFKSFEDLHDSVVHTFNTYMQDASEVICVMKKMRENFAIAA